MNLVLSQFSGVAVIRARETKGSRAGCSELARHVELLASRDLILDLSSVLEVTPADAGALTDAIRQNLGEREIVVVCESPQVRLSLVLAGLDLVVPLVQCREAALAVIADRSGGP